MAKVDKSSLKNAYLLADQKL